MMKNTNIEIPSQKLKCIAMTSPKNAPIKCKAKYKAINISFIIILYNPLLFKSQWYKTLFLTIK